MYEEYDDAQLTGEKCARIQPAEDRQKGDPMTIVDQPCGRGGRCDACYLGAAVQGYQIAVLTPPVGTMGELPDVPPVQRKSGPHDRLHLEDIAKAQQTDPIIRWFVEQVARPLSQGRHPKVRTTPDMHTEAKTMLQQKNLFTLAGGAEYGGHKVLVYREQQVVVPPQF